MTHVCHFHHIATFFERPLGATLARGILTHISLVQGNPTMHHPAALTLRDWWNQRFKLLYMPDASPRASRGGRRRTWWEFDNWWKFVRACTVGRLAENCDDITPPPLGPAAGWLARPPSSR